MHRRLRQALTAVREHSTASYVTMAAVGGFGSVEMIVTKATSPKDMPLNDKYVHELLKVFSISGQASLRRFSLSFTRRFGRTKSWRVALKCLILLHRLLRSTSANPETDLNFRSELLWSKTNGLISLHPCRFRDESSSNSKYYTAFVRSYAHFLDEALSCTVLLFELDKLVIVEEEDEEVIKSLPEKMKEVGRVLEVLPELQSLIDRVMECHPAGPAARSFVIKAAMKSILRDSFGCYNAFQREIAVVMDVLFQLPYSCCVKAFGVYKKSSIQANRLYEFYAWCKEMGLCGIYEYPIVDRIPALQVQALERFFHGIWQFTDSSESWSLSSSIESCSSVTEDDRDDHKAVGPKCKRIDPKKFCNEEEQPLIQLEDDSDDDEDDESWETLLEASVNMSPYANGNQMMMLSYPNGVNPFEQTWMMQQHKYGSLAYDCPMK